MAFQKIYSTEKILADLNRDLPTKPWVQIPDVYALSRIKVEGQSLTLIGRHIVLKAFYNSETAEIKTYLSKALEDVEETKDLS